MQPHRPVMPPRAPGLEGGGFEIGGDLAVTRLTIGEEGHPILVIDNLMRSPGALVDHAVTHACFKPVAGTENYYPGIRAPAPPDYARNLMDALRPLISAHLGVRSARLEMARCAYSIATSRPQELTLSQRLPHFDTVDAHQVAAVHYLCAPEHGGTAFYRHKRTGFETVTRSRSKPYFAALKEDLERLGEPGARYVTEADDIFDQTMPIDARFDRIVVYRSIMLHSGMVNAAAGLSADPASGRLTTTLFARFAP